MNTHKLLDYHLYLQREANFIHEPSSSESYFYDAVSRGDVKQIEENQKKYGKYCTDGKGSLSKNPVRNQIYHLVVNSALLARACVKEGLSHEIAFTLSDIYIRKADTCKTPYEVMDLNDEMVMDFTKRMQEIHTQDSGSFTIRKTTDYICSHLHEKITTALLAEKIGLNRSYLSTLFKKETGMSIQNYILKKRMETAKNMLASTDFDYADIAFSLGFSSQSYFCQCFKEYYHCTPGDYRKNQAAGNI